MPFPNSSLYVYYVRSIFSFTFNKTKLSYFSSLYIISKDEKFLNLDINVGITRLQHCLYIPVYPGIIKLAGGK